PSSFRPGSSPSPSLCPAPPLAMRAAARRADGLRTFPTFGGIGYPARGMQDAPAGVSGFSPRNVLITGGAGFIGSCYARLSRRLRPDGLLVNVDALTYAGNLENLAALESDARHVFIKADIRDGQAM